MNDFMCTLGDLLDGVTGHLLHLFPQQLELLPQHGRLVILLRQLAFLTCTLDGLTL